MPSILLLGVRKIGNNAMTAFETIIFCSFVGYIPNFSNSKSASKLYSRLRALVDKVLLHSNSFNTRAPPWSIKNAFNSYKNENRDWQAGIFIQTCYTMTKSYICWNENRCCDRFIAFEFEVEEERCTVNILRQNCFKHLAIENRRA